MMRKKDTAFAVSFLKVLSNCPFVLKTTCTRDIEMIRVNSLIASETAFLSGVIYRGARLLSAVGTWTL